MSPLAITLLATALAVYFFANVSAIPAHVSTEGTSAAEAFPDFKTQFNKTYATTAEELLRFQIFSARLDEITVHNVDSTRTWKMGVNFFTDLTLDEVVSQYMGAIPPVGAEWAGHSANLTRMVRSTTITAPPAWTLPSSIDWRNAGVVTPVKNQGQCGSCWAFASVGALESTIGIKNNMRWQVPLSEQFLVDCDNGRASDPETNWGCRGGWPNSAYNYIMSTQTQGTSAAGGMPMDAWYPPYYRYTGTEGVCQGSSSGIRIASVEDAGGDEGNLKALVAMRGPAAVCIDAQLLVTYASGVINDPNCFVSTTHCVVAIGYDTTVVNGAPQGYWILKNSWGPSWGEQGYFRLSMGSNMCGVANYGHVPIIE